jgi:transposase
VGGASAEIATAGQAAIAAGLSVREVAGEFLVSPRTAGRWARAVHTSTTTTTSADVAEGSAAATGLPS